MTTVVTVWIAEPAIDDDHLGALRLVRRLAAVPGVEVEVVAGSDGPLLPAFRATAPLLLLDDLNTWRPARTLSSFGWSRLSQLAKSTRLRWWLLRRRNADLAIVVGQTGIEALAAMPVAPRRQVPLVHGRTAPDQAGSTDLGQLAAVLRRRPSATIDVVSDTPDLFDHDQSALSLREAVGSASDPPLVGAVGSTSWWEAPEQFVLWAWLLRARHSDLPAALCWLTSGPAIDLWPLTHDLNIADLAEVTVVNDPDFLDAIPQLEVLVLSGRRPALNLLADAAVRCGVSVVATDNLEGISGIEGVRVVPYLDLHALADAVAAALTARPGRHQLGRSDGTTTESGSG